jgi:hypothetical protein
MLTPVLRVVSRFLPGRHHEDGQALLFVMISLALLISIPIAIATTTINQLPETTRNLNWDAAYEAGQAGLNDYMQHVDASPSYTSFTQKAPDASNPAFTSWVQASTSPLEYYAYSPIAQKGGLIALEVSGKAGKGSTAVVRTFDYTVRPVSSLDYIYWSNYETIDPNIDNGVSNCGYYYGQVWSGGTGPPSNCIIQFITGDVLDGPVFSDDTYRICGTPTFQAQVSSGNTNVAANVIDVDSGCGQTFNPNFSGLTPSKVGNQTPPVTANDVTPAQTYGCYYNGNATIALTSPSNGNTNITVSGATGTTKVGGNTNSCPIGSSFALSSMTSGLIYVNGQVTVSGTMSGFLDIVSASNILVSNNLTYPAGDINSTAGTDTTDSLGLIANNSVEVEPVFNMTIDAAILAVNDSFYVPNWGSVGNQGTLTVFGAIAQNFRGPVGQGSSGYLKAYQYDSSLQSLWPPYFLPPGGATWSPATYSELCPGLTYSVLGTKTPGSC